MSQHESRLKENQTNKVPAPPTVSSHAQEQHVFFGFKGTTEPDYCFI